METVDEVRDIGVVIRDGGGLFAGHCKNMSHGHNDGSAMIFSFAGIYVEICREMRVSCVIIDRELFM